MKVAQVNRLYGKLTPHEQAALSFEAAVRQDDSELSIIDDSVEQVTFTYRGPHTDFRRRATGLYILALFYGSEYWQARTMMASAFKLYYDDDTKETKEYSVMAAKAFMARFASMDVALSDVCGRLKVSADAVKKISDCEQEPVLSSFAEAETVEQYTELFMKAALAA